MADSATQSGGDALDDRTTDDESDTRREPGRNESMTDRVQAANATQLLSSGDPIAVAALVSVVLSWAQFYLRKNRTHGLFIGLWAPTLLAMASYVNSRTDDD